MKMLQFKRTTKASAYQISEDSPLVSAGAAVAGCWHVFEGLNDRVVDDESFRAEYSPRTKAAREALSSPRTKAAREALSSPRTKAAREALSSES